MYESGENYLETILLLQREQKKVRPIDVARTLDYSKPSVSRALALLKEEGCLEIGEGGFILLTQKGSNIAKELLEKHEVITQFLMMTADVPQDIAEEDACRMEHFVNEKTFKGIKKFIKQVEKYHKK